MTLPIIVAQTNGRYSATLVGSPDLRCVAPSRAEAIAALQSEVALKVSRGELVNLEIPALGVQTSPADSKTIPSAGHLPKHHAERDAEPLP